MGDLFSQFIYLFMYLSIYWLAGFRLQLNKAKKKKNAIPEYTVIFAFDIGSIRSIYDKF